MMKLYHAEPAANSLKALLSFKDATMNQFRFKEFDRVRRQPVVGVKKQDRRPPRH